MDFHLLSRLTCSFVFCFFERVIWLKSLAQILLSVRITFLQMKRKETNISWPITKVKESHLKAKKFTTQCECRLVKLLSSSFSLSSFFFFFFFFFLTQYTYYQSWVINHANWPGEYEILRTQKRRFSQITFILIGH